MNSRHALPACFLHFMAEPKYNSQIEKDEHDNTANILAKRCIMVGWNPSSLQYERLTSANGLLQIGATLEAAVTNDGTFALETGGNLAAIKTDLDTIVTNTNKIISAPATSANQATMMTSLSSIDTKLTDGTQKTKQVDASGNVAPAGDTAARAKFVQPTDGTNSPNVLKSDGTAAGQNAQMVAGAYVQYAGGSITKSSASGSIDAGADFLTQMDASGYKSLFFQFTGTFSATFQVQESADNLNWKAVQALDGSANSWAGNLGGASTYSLPITQRYIRIRCTAFVSNASLAGNITLSTLPYTPRTINAAQNGTWTNKLSDGTNTANILPATSVSNAIASQAALLTAGAYAEQASLSAGSLNADLVPSTDVSNYKAASLHINGTYSGTITIQGSDDNSNFQSVFFYDFATGSGGTTTGATNKLIMIPLGFRYLRVRMTSYTSGTATGTLELYTQPGFVNSVLANQNGTWTVGANSATGSGVPANAFYGALRDGSGNLTGFGSANSQSDAASGGGQLAVHSSLYNGSTYDKPRSNEDVTLLASSSRTTTQTSADLVNYNGKSALSVVVDVTTPGTGSITVSIDYKDTASGKYINLLTGAAITTASTNRYRVTPDLAAVANSIAQDHLPRTFRIVITANNANAMTYSVGYSLVR